MAVYKRGKYYYMDFRFLGQRIKEAIKTGSRKLAEEAERKRRREFEEGYNGLRRQPGTTVDS